MEIFSFTIPVQEVERRGHPHLDKEDGQKKNIKISLQVKYQLLKGSLLRIMQSIILIIDNFSTGLGTTCIYRTSWVQTSLFQTHLYSDQSIELYTFPAQSVPGPTCAPPPPTHTSITLSECEGQGALYLTNLAKDLVPSCISLDTKDSYQWAKLTPLCLD